MMVWEKNIIASNENTTVYVAEYVSKITDGNVTCYVRGPSGISCLNISHL